MAKQSTLVPANDDPMPKAAWEIVYHDSFDHSSSSEITGVGLIPALMELWVRFVNETVTEVSRSDDQGSITREFGRAFNSFSLRIDTHRFEIDGSYVGGGKLKGWMFVDKDRYKSAIESANLDLLRAIAHAHAASADLEKAGLPILDAAEAAADLESFLATIARM